MRLSTQTLSRAEGALDGAGLARFQVLGARV